jgi:hypothetical protein
MSQDELEKRIRALEIRAAMMLGSIATLAICCVAFLGFEYYRIPHQIQKQVEDKIGRDTWELVDKVIERAKRMEGRSVQVFEDVWNGNTVSPPIGTKKDDWVAFILPAAIGFDKERKKEHKEIEEGEKPRNDNALLSFHLNLVDIKDGWKAEVLCTYKIGTLDSSEHIKEYPGKSTVILVPRLDLQPSNEPNSADA